MKICIVQELNQYSIYKVSDHLMEKFKDEKGERIVIKGRNITDAVKQFTELDKQPGIEFNSELLKYKQRQEERIEDLEPRNRSKFKLNPKPF